MATKRFSVSDADKPNHVVFQGGVLIWKRRKLCLDRRPPTREGTYTTFSVSARFRLLKLLNAIDYEKAKPGIFISLTFPDETILMDKTALTQARSVFWRYVETYRKEQVTAIWRIEWKDRQSGLYVGEYKPHFHFMVYKQFYIPYAKVNEWWKKSIHHVGYLRTQTKRMVCEAQTGYYLSKYVAKPGPCSLVIAANLNIPSQKHWGAMRRPLLPLYEKIESLLPDTDTTEFARETARRLRPEINEWGSDSFTLFGPEARKVWGIISQDAVANTCVFV